MSTPMLLKSIHEGTPEERAKFCIADLIKDNYLFCDLKTKKELGQNDLNNLKIENNYGLKDLFTITSVKQYCVEKLYEQGVISCNTILKQYDNPFPAVSNDVSVMRFRVPKTDDIAQASKDCKYVIPEDLSHHHNIILDFTDHLKLDPPLVTSDTHPLKDPHYVDAVSKYIKVDDIKMNDNVDAHGIKLKGYDSPTYLVCIEDAHNYLDGIDYLFGNVEQHTEL